MIFKRLLNIIPKGSDVMEQEVVKLIHCLSLGKELYMKIGKLSLLEKRVIAKEDIKELDLIVSEENNLIEKMSDVNKEIQSIFDRISNYMSIKKGQLTITKIIENLESVDLKHKLRIAAKDFNDVFYKQKKLNKINQDLLMKKLGHIKSMMHSIMLENENSTYDNEGFDKEIKRQKINIFDERV